MRRLVVGFILSLGAPAWAQEPFPLRQGEVALFDGMLVPYLVAAALTAEAEGCPERIKKVRKEEREIATLKLKLIEDLRISDQMTFDERIGAMEDALQAAQPVWWQSPTLWFGIGVISALGLIGASVVVLEATQNPTLISY